MTTPGIAANAYAQLARITEGAGSLAKTVGDGAEHKGPDFAAVLSKRSTTSPRPDTNPTPRSGR